MNKLLAATAICLCVPCWAQSPPAAPASAATGAREPKVQRSVIEDDAVRIDELRVRGQTRSIIVRPKLPGAPAYEIGSRADGRDPMRDSALEGRSLWQLLAF